MTTTTDVQEQVRNFYGREVARTEDLAYSACCVDAVDPALLEHLTEEVLARRYGCESPLPPLLAGCTVVDLGCGAGADCFVAAKLVGPEGRVIGVDMTPEQLEVARRNVEPIMANLGYERPNVEFLEGRIEELPLPDASADVVISNCVINLVPDKRRVFAEVWRILKPGGEFYIGDIVADRRVPEHLRTDTRLYNECLTSAAYEGDLFRILRAVGFADARVVRRRRLAEVIEGVHFDSVILRGFKLPLEDACEDYGQVAVYRGTIPDHPAAFDLDDHHHFPAGTAVRVCGNTATILRDSRYGSHFLISEPLGHLGRFACGTPAPELAAERQDAGASCGC